MSDQTTTVSLTIESGQEPDGSPLQSEVILPAQFFAELRRHASGERLLLVAVLEDAIKCFQKFLFANRARDRRLFREAEQWMMEASRAQSANASPYFSFEQICNVLGLDPDYVRGGLRRWRQRQLTSVCQHAFSLASGPLSRSAPKGRQRGLGELADLRVA